jgi:hypothetical protein
MAIKTSGTTFFLFIFTFIVLLSPFSRAQDNSPKPNSAPREAKEKGMESILFF